MSVYNNVELKAKDLEWGGQFTSIADWLQDGSFTQESARDGWSSRHIDEMGLDLDHAVEQFVAHRDKLLRDGSSAMLNIYLEPRYWVPDGTDLSLDVWDGTPPEIFVHQADLNMADRLAEILGRAKYSIQIYPHRYQHMGLVFYYIVGNDLDDDPEWPYQRYVMIFHDTAVDSRKIEVPTAEMRALVEHPTNPLTLVLAREDLQVLVTKSNDPRGLSLTGKGFAFDSFEQASRALAGSQAVVQEFLTHTGFEPFIEGFSRYRWGKPAGKDLIVDLKFRKEPASWFESLQAGLQNTMRSFVFLKMSRDGYIDYWGYDGGVSVFRIRTTAPSPMLSFHSSRQSSLPRK